MKLVDEKKALNEISALRKSRKLVESFATQQDAIDADKAKVDEVRKELDDPEQKAASKKFDELRKELDEINRRMDEVSKGRDGLFEERNAGEAHLSLASFAGSTELLTSSTRPLQSRSSSTTSSRARRPRPPPSARPTTSTVRRALFSVPRPPGPRSR